ncbi:unnamed protein product [Leuciscus chuanchicus]
MGNTRSTRTLPQRLSHQPSLFESRAGLCVPLRSSVKSVSPVMVTEAISEPTICSAKAAELVPEYTAAPPEDPESAATPLETSDSTLSLPHKPRKRKFCAVLQSTVLPESEESPVSAPAPEHSPVSAPAPKKSPVSAPAPKHSPVSAPAPEQLQPQSSARSPLKPLSPPFFL